MFKSTVFIDITHIRFQAIFPPFFPFLSLFLSPKPFEDFFFYKRIALRLKVTQKMEGRNKEGRSESSVTFLIRPNFLNYGWKGVDGRRGCKASVVSRMENSQEGKERKKRMIFL